VSSLQGNPRQLLDSGLLELFGETATGVHGLVANTSSRAPPSTQPLSD
jgi:hypothetical protein